MTAKRTTDVDVDIDLGAELGAAVKKHARACGVSVNEFIADTVQWRVRSEAAYDNDRNFTPHGGKHKMGKSTGYEITADGSYYPAPLWAARFAQLFAERTAITNLINHLVTIGQERLIQVEKLIHKAKDELIADVGADPKKDWAYYGGDNCLREVKPETKKTKR